MGWGGHGVTPSGNVEARARVRAAGTVLETNRQTHDVSIIVICYIYNGEISGEWHLNCRTKQSQNKVVGK